MGQTYGRGKSQMAASPHLPAFRCTGSSTWPNNKKGGLHMRRNNKYLGHGPMAPLDQFVFIWQHFITLCAGVQTRLTRRRIRWARGTTECISEQELVQAIQRLNLPYLTCGATTAVSQLFRAGTLELRESLCCWKAPVGSRPRKKAQRGYFP